MGNHSYVTDGNFYEKREQTEFLSDCSVQFDTYKDVHKNCLCKAKILQLLYEKNDCVI